MIMNEIINALKKELAKKTENCFLSIYSLISPNSSLYDDIIVIEAMFNHANDDWKFGKISSAEHQTILAKVRSNLLDLINNFTEKDFAQIDTSSINSNSSVLKRGDFREQIVDGIFNLSLTDDELYNNFHSAIDDGEKIPEELMYWDRETAYRWLRYEKSISANNEHLIPAIHFLKEYLNGKPFDFVSLGAGTGLKDKLFLEELLIKDKPIWYYPIDISMTLLEHCLKVITKSFDNKDIKVKGIRSDFRSLEKLKYVYKYSNELNIFSILGNTLGNYPDGTLLNMITRTMHKNDLLIIEVNALNDELKEKQEGDLVDSGKFGNSLYENFILGPLESKGFKLKNGKLMFSVSKKVEIPNSVKVVAEYAINNANKKKRHKINITYSIHYDIQSLIKYIENQCKLTFLFGENKNNKLVAIFRK